MEPRELAAIVGNSGGASGSATANATAPGSGLVTLVSSQAVSPVTLDGAAVANGGAVVGQAESLVAFTGTGVGALGVGSPLASDVNNAWGSAPAVEAALGAPANAQGLAFLNAADVGGSASSALDFQSDVTFTLNAGLLSSNDLQVGLLNAYGNLQGSDTVAFEIIRQGVTVFDETFSSNAALQTFFTNNVLDFGPENAGVTGGTLTLEFKLDLLSSSSGSNFSPNIVFGRAGAIDLAPLGLGRVSAGFDAIQKYPSRARLLATAIPINQLGPRFGRDKHIA